MTAMRTSLSAALLAVCFTLPDAAAQAEDCTLKQVAALTFTTLPNGKPAVPVKIAGHDEQMALATDNAHSAVINDVRTSLHLDYRSLPPFVSINYGHHPVTKAVTLSDFQIGAVRVPSYEVLLIQEPTAPDAAGTLGLDVLSNFDMELDLKAGKLNLFSQDHCPGQVVYWGAPYAVLPFKVDKVGAFYFDMTLDGKPISVSFATEDAEGDMGMSDAHDVFGIAPNDPALTAAGQDERRGGALYSYPFKTLSLSGIAVANPHILLYPQAPSDQCERGALKFEHGQMTRCYGASQVTLGRSVLRKLHLYFAFKEKKLYVTAADPEPAKPAASGL